MPGIYLAAILISILGLLVANRRLRLGVRGRPLVAAIVVVELAFLAFDWVGASRGWFASNPDWVVAIAEPGIPPEEPLLLAFLACFAVTIYVLGERTRRRR